LAERPPRDQHHLAPEDRDYLLAHAIRIWRYFCEFSSERHNYLIPDNVMERDGARRLKSLPQYCLLLNARQAACELGFLTIPSLLSFQAGRANLERMEKFRVTFITGTTRKRCALSMLRVVSSSTAGILRIAFHSLCGRSRIGNQPLLAWIIRRAACGHSRAGDGETYRRSRIAHPGARSLRKKRGLDRMAARRAGGAYRGGNSPLVRATIPGDSRGRVARRRDSQPYRRYLPWALPEFAPLRAVRQLELNENSASSLFGSFGVRRETANRMMSARRVLAADEMLAELADRLHPKLQAAIQNLRALHADLRRIAQSAESLASRWNLLSSSILTARFFLSAMRWPASATRGVLRLAGLRSTDRNILGHCARRSCPAKLAETRPRSHPAYGKFLLLSWSGTMFEYLMPALWMRSYPGTLIANTLDACVHVQQAYGNSLGIPWGVSESASSRKNDRGHYHYFAYGIPCIALWFEATAALLSLLIPRSSRWLSIRTSIGNLRRMESEGWVGTYGFYEAADFTISPRAPSLARNGWRITWDVAAGHYKFIAQ